MVRTSGLYGPRPCRVKGGLNFPRLTLKLAGEQGQLTVVTDEVVGPTYTPDLARQLVALAATRRLWDHPRHGCGGGVLARLGQGDTALGRPF